MTTALESFVRVSVHWRYKGQEGWYHERDGRGSCWEEDGELNTFMWDEGNYSCDCNRARFFGFVAFPCGDTIEVLEIVPLTEENRW